MNKKLFSLTKLSFLTILVGICFPFRVFAIPSQYQQCTAGGSCKVGEFVFDDTYAPVTTASCTIKSIYPNGTVFVNSQPMTHVSEGWYEYTVVASGSAGLYRTHVCCTVDGENMCLDKSFEITTASSSASLTSGEIASAVWDASRTDHTSTGTFGEALQNVVPSTSDIASAVWSYSSRTLSTFGTLVSDIWSHSTRSITSFGTLASDIWNNSTRTLTGVDLSSGSIATKSDVDRVKSEVSNIIATTSGSLDLNNAKLDRIDKNTKENRLLLEQVINKPIIQNFLEDDQTPNLQVKLDQTKNISTQLYITTSRIGGKLGLLRLKWNQATNKELIVLLDEVSTFIGTEKSSSTLVGGISSLKKSWNMALLEDMYLQSGAMKTKLASLNEEVHLYGKSKMAYDDLQQIILSFSRIENGLGTAKDTAKQNTFFGRIDHIKKLALEFDKNTAEIDTLLAHWKSFTPAVIKQKAQVLAENITPLNSISQAVISVDGATTDKQLKNKFLEMKGVIDTNRKLLARSSEKPLINMWLEEGSIVFKSIITNPSSLISQTVPMKYYLPKEVTKESVLHVDEGLEVEYDNEKDQLFVSGNFDLTPEETRTLSVTVDDTIFSITEEQIASVRSQADQLAEPLKKTSFFAQSVTLKSDIDVALNKVVQLQKNAVTPDGRIRSYREARIEFEGAQVKVDKLKDLVTQAGSAGSLMGFVGGAQVLAVWGLIIIFIAGFVFLVIYMRVLKAPTKELAGEEDKVPASKIETIHPKKETEHIAKSKKYISTRAVKYAVILILFGAFTSSLSGVGVYAFMQGSSKGVALEPIQRRHQVSSNESVKVLGMQTEVVDTSEDLPTQEHSASPSAINSMVDVPHLSEQMVKVIDNPAGFLRVRKTPGGVELTRLSLGDTLSLVQERKGWSQIRMVDGSLGWVSSKYIKIIEE